MCLVVFLFMCAVDFLVYFHTISGFAIRSRVVSEWIYKYIVIYADFSDIVGKVELRTS